MKTKEEIFYNKLVHYNPTQFPNGMKKAFLKAMDEYAKFKTLENLKRMQDEYPDHYGLHQVLDREILTIENTIPNVK